MRKHIAPIIEMFVASWLHLSGPVWHGEAVGKVDNFMAFLVRIVNIFRW